MAGISGDSSNSAVVLGEKVVVHTEFATPPSCQPPKQKHELCKLHTHLELTRMRLFHCF